MDFLRTSVELRKPGDSDATGVLASHTQLSVAEWVPYAVVVQCKVEGAM